MNISFLDEKLNSDAKMIFEKSKINFLNFVNSKINKNILINALEKTHHIKIIHLESFSKE